MVLFEATVFDGVDRGDEMFGDRLDLDEIALLALGPVERRDRLGFQRDDLDRLASIIAHLSDAARFESELDLAILLGQLWMIEAAQVNTQSTRQPPIAADAERACFALLAIAHPREPTGQIETLPVDAGVDHDRRGIDAGGHGEAATLETRHDPAIEIE